MMMRIYMAGAMFTQADAEYNLRLAATLRGHGFEVFCPNESEPINDKTRTDVTGRMIYDVDIGELEASNVVLFQVSEDSGSNWEAGYMDALSKHVAPDRYYGVVGMATDIRLQSMPNPAQSGVDNQAGYLNPLVVGGLQKSLGVYRTEDEAIARLLEVRARREPLI
jgi:nucleoside 2-deoxyribosyltransferase